MGACFSKRTDTHCGRCVVVVNGRVIVEPLLESVRDSVPRAATAQTCVNMVKAERDAAAALGGEVPAYTLAWLAASMAYHTLHDAGIGCDQPLVDTGEMIVCAMLIRSSA
eukprot:jgi/Mesvir1/10263/Mv13868-RA.1